MARIPFLLPAKSVAAMMLPADRRLHWDQALKDSIEAAHCTKVLLSGPDLHLMDQACSKPGADRSVVACEQCPHRAHQRRCM